MKIIHLSELDCWAVVEYPNGTYQLPQLTTFTSRAQAQQYISGNPPSLLSKFKLYFEKHNPLSH